MYRSSESFINSLCVRSSLSKDICNGTEVSETYQCNLQGGFSDRVAAQVISCWDFRPKDHQTGHSLTFLIVSSPSKLRGSSVYWTFYQALSVNARRTEYSTSKSEF